MAHPISLTFGNLTHLANTLGDDTSIVVKNGGFETRGKIGSFFTRKATNRHAGNVLFAALRQQYGDTVADALAPRMRSIRVEGKPLSARIARDILADAAAMHQGIGRINTDMARHFVLGNTGQGDSRNLDTALDAFCAGRGISDAERQELKNKFGEAMLRIAKNETQKILSYQDMSDMVRTAGQPAIMKAWNGVLADRFMNDPAHGAGAALDACAARMNLDPAQKQELRKLIGMAVRHEAEIMAEKGVEFNAEQIFRNVADGNLPALKSFAYTCGKGDAPNSVAQSMLAWATPATAADLSMLSVQIANFGGIAAGALASQRLEEIRNLQPEGLISRETLWQGCFHEAMPDKLKDVDFRGFNDAVFDRLGEMFQQTRPDSATVSSEGMTTLAAGLSLEKTVESLLHPVAVTLDDFVNRPTLTPPSELKSLQEVEASLAKDINRRGTHSSLPGYMPTISFGAAGGNVETVRIQDTSGITEDEKEQFRQGHPSPISRSLVDHALRLCGDNEIQARQLIQSMGQSGAFLVRTGSPVTGIAESEHSPLDIDIRREENGNVTMRFHKPEASPLDIDYTFTITPDGQSTLTACRIQARGANAA